jgi:LysR family transcriptional regulator, chromosome initiation inhibitor
MSLLSPQLQAFIAICENKTVHAAADRLHLTQTAVTQRIRVLENQLKVSLFTRTRRGMIPTPEAEALLRYCNASQFLEGEALAQIKGTDVKSSIQITITGPTSLMQSRIIPQCLPVMKAHSQLLMHFDFYDENHGEDKLRSGKSQFVIIRPESVAKEMKNKKLKPEKYILVAPAAWKDRTLEDIIQNEHIIDFNPSDSLTFNYLKYFGLAKHAQHGRHFANHPESIAGLIAKGNGYSLLTKEFSQPYINKGELIALNQDKIYKSSFSLAWYDRPNPPEYFQALIKAID